ncbi:hypothetical protein BVAVS116_H0075 (plasmid) [Borreliella valaisiana VS116]|uniref:Uncharacterized protein n=1 Tax=Borreliella valaisiana VS116 TaxID=445987 RepID=C0R8Z0_BORVA|nr:hypothetical protein BVAVS116_H0075 [Borreliella valaisiana VS116]
MLVVFLAMLVKLDSKLSPKPTVLFCIIYPFLVDRFSFFIEFELIRYF